MSEIGVYSLLTHCTMVVFTIYIMSIGGII